MRSVTIDPDLAETTGQYFNRREPIPSSQESYDLTRADELSSGSGAASGQATSGTTPVPSQLPPVDARVVRPGRSLRS